MAKVPAYKPRQPSKTEAAIEAAMDADGGDLYRALLQKWLPRMQDAYRQGDSPFRSHFGLSGIGDPCDRSLWLKWRWFGIKQVKPRLRRLFNRGHLEEARFLALLEMIGVHVHDTGEDGQDRVSTCGGHVGSALDGTLYNVPDAPGEWVLGEFKTHNTKQFSKLVTDGVRVAKPEHYAQIQSCMKLRGIHKTLYMAVNKNDDDLYCELIEFDAGEGERRVHRASTLALQRTPPKRLSDDASDDRCRFCDMLEQCHYNAPVLINCRTCKHSVADPGGTWGCELKNIVLDKAAQMAGCDQHQLIEIGK